MSRSPTACKKCTPAIILERCFPDYPARYNPFQPGISSNIDDRTMHELYLWPFAEGIRAGVTSVMTAYNAVSLSSSIKAPLLTLGRSTAPHARKTATISTTS